MANILAIVSSQAKNHPRTAEPARAQRVWAAVLMSLAAAVILAGCGPAVSAPSSVVDAPTRVAETAAGPVGYRELGTGSPLLLITGLGASMDDWAPSFVATLATHHRVVVLDNAGVGKTGDLASPLGIIEMARETSALISTLRLGPSALLGWSMGGMVAQALAVLHPSQVSRIVLAATQPGTGHALPIPAAAAAAVASSDPAKRVSVLFPRSAPAAERDYLLSILRYPHFYQAPRAAVAAQNAAVEQWMAGRDPAGSRFDQVRLPVMVAGGTEDQLDPSSNDRMLAGEVPGASLVLYSGAGHAFLFQDSARFLPSVQRFLQ
jgi:pimeloyl-ACP methyl ester carboxylesterase